MFELTGEAGLAAGALPPAPGAPAGPREQDELVADSAVEPAETVEAPSTVESVPSQPRERLAWLTRELRQVGRRVAAGEFVTPPVEPAVPSEDASRSIAPVLSVAPVDAVRVEVLELLESLKSVAAAAQARVTTAFAASQESAALSALGFGEAHGADSTEVGADGACDGDGDQQRARARRRVRAQRLARSSVVGQVGLARRISPARAAGCVAAARAWTSDLPRTLAALDAGEVSEWGAEIVARETTTLSPVLRRRVDEQVGEGLRCWSERQVRAAVIARGYALDPRAAVKRHEKAVGERRVSTRPAADGMVWLTALLPVVPGIACQAALSSAASAAKAAGDGRGSGQLMADLLVEAVTGQSAGTPDLPGWVSDPTRWDSTEQAPTPPSETQPDPRPDPRPDPQPESQPSPRPATPGETGAGGAAGASAGSRRAEAARAPGGPPAVPVEVQVVVSAEALWGDPDDPGYDQPAHVPGYGPIPAWLARHLVREAPDATPEAAGTAGTGGTAPATSARAATFLRRLWACPDTGALVALESRRRVFDGGLRRFLIARDQTCRTPYCDAPLRQVDHVRPYADGGATTAGNGQGLCTRCNQTKEAPGWHADAVDVAVVADAAAGDGSPTTTASATRHAVRVTTPTGRTYRSTAPPFLPVARRPASGRTTPRRLTPDRRPTPDRRLHLVDDRLRAFLLRS